MALSLPENAVEWVNIEQLAAADPLRRTVQTLRNYVKQKRLPPPVRGLWVLDDALAVLAKIQKGRGGRQRGESMLNAPANGEALPAADVESLDAARCRKETALADLRQIEVAKRRGELLEVTEVQREWEDVLRMVRARVLATVSRIRTRCPHLTVLDAQAIDAELRAALMELGEGRDGSESEA